MSTDGVLPGIRLYQKYLFALLSLVYMVPFIQNIVMTVVAKDVMRDLRLTPDRMGMLGSVYLCGYGVSMLFSGLLSARFGPRRFLSAMFFLAGAGCLLFAWTDSFAVACLARVMCGAGSAVVLTSALTLFARWYRAESFSTLCAVFFSIGGLGALLGSAPLAMLNAAWGWRACFVLVAGATVLYAAAVALTARDWPPAGTEDGLGIAAAPRNPVTPADMWQAVRKVSGSRDFWYLALWFFGMSGIYLSYAGLWAVPYFKDVYRFSDAEAGTVLSMFSFGFVVGNPALSWLCGKKLRSNRAGLCGAALLGLAATLPLFLFAEGIGVYAHIVIALCIGVAVNAPNAIIYSSARNIFGSRLAGMASGALASVSFASGALLQVVCGVILTWAGSRGLPAKESYLLAFSPYIPCCIMAAVCGLALSRASDPGHVSPLSWRRMPKKEDSTA